MHPMFNKQETNMTLLIALNLLPIWGVWQWGWTPFMVFYLFWLETLIISGFNALKIVFCRGDEYENKLENSNHKFSDVHVKWGSHIAKAFSYFVIRVGIFFFYLLFIVVFIGFIMSGNDDDKQVMSTLLFFNKSFNYALLGFILNQAIQFIFNFILNDDFKRTHPSDFAAIFDGRQIIIHVAVVIGGVFGGFVGGAFTHDSSPTTPTYQMAVYLFVISVFCVVKTIYEVMKFKGIIAKQLARI